RLMMNSTDNRAPLMTGLPVSMFRSRTMRGWPVIVDSSRRVKLAHNTEPPPCGMPSLPPAGKSRRGRPRSWASGGGAPALGLKAPLPDRLRHCLPARHRIRVPPEVARAQRLLPEHALDGVHDGPAGFLLAEVLQHHGAGPDLA